MSSSQKRLLAGLTCATMVQHGILLLLPGALLPAMMRTFGIRESAAGIMLGVGSAGFIAAPLLAGLLSDRAGPRTVFLIGLGCEIAMLCALGVAPSFVTATIAYFAINLGAGFIETPVNIVPTILEERQSGSLMNLVHMFFGVGAFISPFLSGLILQTTGSWRPVCFWAVIPTAMLFAAFWQSSFPSIAVAPSERQAAKASLSIVVRDRAVLLGGLALLLYVAAEFGVSNWVVLYLQKDLHFATVPATSGLSLLWGGLVAGRFLNSRLALHRSSRELVWWSAGGGLVGGLAFLAVRSPMAAYAWLVFIGVAMAGVYPNIMAELNGRNPERMGVVTGVLAQAATMGSMFAQPALGRMAEVVGLRIVLAVPAALMGLVGLVYAGVGAADTLTPVPSPDSGRGET